jgi:hypothetical protein
MGAGFYSQLSDILLENGCRFVRQGKGNHEIWLSPITQKNISVPVTVVSRFTANAILRQAGITKRLYSSGP